MLKLILNQIFFIRLDNNYLIMCMINEFLSYYNFMISWINIQYLYLTFYQLNSIFYTRKNSKIWFKGYFSYNLQFLKKINLDCDMDIINLYLLQVNNICCHYLNYNCFMYNNLFI